MKINYSYWQAIATLVGTIVGAGILGVPYAISRFGFWPGLAMLVLLGLAVLLINLMMGEIILRTKQRHQLMGYARKYVGKWAGRLEGFSMLFANFGALAAYMIGIGIACRAIFGGEAFWYSLAAAVIGSLLIWIGLNVIKKVELVMTAFLILAVLVIAFIIWPHINYENFNPIDLSKFYVPYGVLLFAYGGIYSVYSVRKILERKEKLMKNAIVMACVLPIVLYGVFAFLVLGLNGTNATEVATIGLGAALGSKILVWANLFSVVSMFTSFLAIGISLWQLFHFDYRLKKTYSWLLVAGVPMVIYLLGNTFFIKTLSIVGSVAVGLTGIIMILTYWRAKKSKERKPEYVLPRFKFLGWGLIFMFFSGIIITLIEELI
ncbi:MAG TPA: aromatic amino acid transport family protein [Candidatus Bipolaricaulota bacterium]|nr:aromatic amino acid transport family protein [Candidatus Bipolaricaulota bacterium]